MVGLPDAPVAPVTGAATGIGRSIAPDPAGEGACLVVADEDEDATRRASEAIRAAGFPGRRSRSTVATPRSQGVAARRPSSRSAAPARA